MADTNARRGRGRPRTFDRAHVIDVAMNSYWSEGVYGLSLNEICRRAGVSKPGMYREFGGEDGLMESALAHYAGSILAPLIEQLASEAPFTEVLAQMIVLMTQSNPGGPAGCLLTKLRGAPSRLGPATQARVALLRDTTISAYTDWIEHAKARGEVAVGIPTNVAAALLDTYFTTLMAQMAAGEDPDLVRAQAQLAFAGLTGLDAYEG
jgi:TetR/AcrR family transcriptional regulator, copper-responsive repressor